MKRLVAVAGVIAVVGSVIAGAVRASTAWNAALSAQEDVTTLMRRKQHAQAAAIGHRYFTEKKKFASTAEECMLLTTIASAELSTKANAAALETLVVRGAGCQHGG